MREVDDLRGRADDGFNVFPFDLLDFSEPTLKILYLFLRTSKGTERIRNQGWMIGEQLFVLTRSRVTSSRLFAFSHCRMMEGSFVLERLFALLSPFVGSFVGGDGRSYVFVVTEGRRLGIIPRAWSMSGWRIDIRLKLLSKSKRVCEEMA